MAVWDCGALTELCMESGHVHASSWLRAHRSFCMGQDKVAVSAWTGQRKGDELMITTASGEVESGMIK